MKPSLLVNINVDCNVTHIATAVELNFGTVVFP